MSILFLRWGRWGGRTSSDATVLVTNPSLKHKVFFEKVIKEALPSWHDFLKPGPISGSVYPR
ncbi:hypothetical protein PSAB6_10005 [Paraburkholderia sabiae]|nr:hypothetical protein PSAB6_10005 [Paraburkholderia sabiae]